MSAVSAVIALTIFLIAANAMSMMVRERLRDVAVLRALGFKQPYIARVLFGECALIGTAGGALGCALALWQFGSGTTLRAVLESAGYLTVTYGAALEALLAAIAISLSERGDSGVGCDAGDAGRRLSQDDLNWLPADRVTNRVQYVDEVARRFYVAEKRYPLQHFHLVAGDIVDAPDLFVLAKIFPRRLRVGVRLRTE